MTRPKKPLLINKGSFTKEEKAKRELEESLVVGNVDKLEAPKWLINKFALEEFYKLLTELKEIDLVCNLDMNNLANYCEALSKYAEATLLLEEQPLTIKKCMPNGQYTMVENPLIGIQKKYAEELRRFANLCGLTVDSRLKIGAMKAEKLESKVGNEFGDI